MKRKDMFLRFLGLSLMILLIASCRKSDDPGKAYLNVHLTDGPGQYDAVFVDVQKVEIHSDVSGWVSVVPVIPGVYNLLDFRNGMDTLLCKAGLPAGRVSQMRLVLGSNNSVVVDGTSYPLATPSAMQSGLKFNMKADLVADAAYDIWIDFDVAHSIVENGKGEYSLKPVIRTYNQLTNGRIKGIVLPAMIGTVVYASNGIDTYSAIPDATGYFMFCGLPEGVYTLTFDATVFSGLKDVELPNVAVNFGIITNVGTVTLIP